MKAVIMAGGEGTRLRPLTCSKPKPMVTVANKPVMEHIIELLNKHKITDIAVTLQYMPLMIKDYFGDGKSKNVNLHYYVEDVPLGTAGSVKNAEDFLDETFIVISGDALTDIDLEKAIRFHKDKGAMVTLVLKKVDIPLDYGVVVLDDEGKITKFLEKPSWSEVFSDTVNTGIYILSPQIFSYFQKGVFFDFSRDLFPMLLKDGKPMYGYVTEEYWCDIGDLNAYNQANIDALNNKVNVNIPYKYISDGIWMGDNVKVNEKAKIIPPVIIGNNSSIGADSSIGPNCIIGDDCIIDSSSSIKKSVLLKNICVSKLCEIRGATLCDKVFLHDGVMIFENAVIGDFTTINKNACIKPEVKIWPEKLIEEEAEIHSNIIWGSRVKRSIFGNRGVCGEINVDITPEFASRLGASFAACQKAGKKIAVACDGEIPSIMLKSAISAGVMSVGVNVEDYGKSIIPTLRHLINSKNLEGGIYISAVSSLDSKMNIYILDSKGLDLDRGMERKIETLFMREDYRRGRIDEIGSLEIKDFDAGLYVDELFKMLDSSKIGAKIAYYTPLDISDEIIRALLKKTNSKGARILPDKYIDSEALIVEELNKCIKSKCMDIGVLFDRNFEKLVLVDKSGKVYKDDNISALVSLALLDSKKTSTLVVPYNTTKVIDEIAEIKKAKVLRTKTSSQELMKAILSQKDNSSELQMSANFDAIFTTFFLLLTVSKLGKTFEAFVAGLPTVNVKKREVFCPWSAKGKVIRELIHDKDAHKECLEGVMLSSNSGRVLILPDAERPICNIISEASTVEFADELSLIYQDKVKSIGKNNSVL